MFLAAHNRIPTEEHHVDTMASMTPKKSVRFASVEVIEFRVGYTSCAVPSTGGPPVGLIGAPVRRKTYEISQDEQEIEEEDRAPRGDINHVWIDPRTRAQILADMHQFNHDDIALLCREVRAIQDSRAVARLDFDSAYALSSCDFTQLQILRELRYSAQPVQSQREKVTLFDCAPTVGILA